MQYFWYTYHDLPDGVGFSYFGAKHLAALFLIAAGIVICCLIFLRLKERGREIMLKSIALLTAAGEIARDTFLFCVGRMGVEYLPLHLCSLSIGVFLLHAFLKECRFKEALGEIAWCLLLPGSMCALLFPNWTAYPMLTFMSLHSFIWHGMLLLYPILLLCGGRIHPAVKHWWYAAVFLLIVTPPIYAFDKATGYNYFFILFPQSGTPLKMLYNIMGDFWRVGYALAALAVILIMLFAGQMISRRISGKGKIYEKQRDTRL